MTSDLSTLAIVAIVFVLLLLWAERHRLQRIFRSLWSHIHHSVEHLDDLIDPAQEQPRKDVALVRGTETLQVAVRGLSASEYGFLQRSGGQPARIISLALVEPRLTEAEVRAALLPGEQDQLTALIMELSGLTR